MAMMSPRSEQGHELQGGLGCFPQKDTLSPNLQDPRTGPSMEAMALNGVRWRPQEEGRCPQSHAGGHHVGAVTPHKPRDPSFRSQEVTGV